MSKRSLQWVIISQSMAILGAGFVFPFYIIFIKEVGSTFTQFGISYGLFTISSALVHQWIGRHSDRVGRKIFLLLYAWGTATVFLFFPMVTSIWQVYLLQVVLGIFGAMQRTSEKALIADLTDEKSRGKQIGTYHSWIAIFSGIAIMAGGYLIDLLTLEFIFYLGSMVLFISGFFVLKIKEGVQPKA